jgi:hypothetical protein
MSRRWRAYIQFLDDTTIEAVYRDTPGEAIKDLEALMDDEEFQGIDKVQWMQVEPETN